MDIHINPWRTQVLRIYLDIEQRERVVLARPRSTISLNVNTCASYIYIDRERLGCVVLVCPHSNSIFAMEFIFLVHLSTKNGNTRTLYVA